MFCWYRAALVCTLMGVGEWVCFSFDVICIQKFFVTQVFIWWYWVFIEYLFNKMICFVIQRQGHQDGRGYWGRWWRRNIVKQKRYRNVALKNIWEHKYWIKLNSPISRHFFVDTQFCLCTVKIAFVTKFSVFLSFTRPRTGSRFLWGPSSTEWKLFHGTEKYSQVNKINIYTA